MGLDLLSVGVVLVVLAADIPPAAHVGAWEGEGSGGGLLEGGLLGGGIPGVQCSPTQGRPVLSGPRLQGRLGLLVPLLKYLVPLLWGGNTLPHQKKEHRHLVPGHRIGNKTPARSDAVQSC